MPCFSSAWRYCSTELHVCIEGLYLQFTETRALSLYRFSFLFFSSSFLHCSLIPSPPLSVSLLLLRLRSRVSFLRAPWPTPTKRQPDISLPSRTIARGFYSTRSSNLEYEAVSDLPPWRMSDLLPWPQYAPWFVLPSLPVRQAILSSPRKMSRKGLWETSHVLQEISATWVLSNHLWPVLI
jgi:hypothetical protein